MFDFEQDYDWRGLIAASSSSGSIWVEKYLRVSKPVNAMIKAAANSLRQRQYEQGHAFLAEAEAQRQALKPEAPSIFYAIGRFYFGGLAFAHYCGRDFDAADRTMMEAHHSIQMALESEPHLLPFAALGLDIPLKRARIAQARRQWSDMRGHVCVMQRMVADRYPLCVLFGEKPIYYSTIAELFGSRQSLEDGLAPAIRFLTRPVLRKELLLHLLAQLYAPPGFLIPFP